jgi:endo-1,4-beta-D-glucanase Y
VLDAAFASDADQDAALALIMASKTWNEPAYLSQARATLADLWNQGTLVIQGRRYLLGGDSLCQGSSCRLNPSYYAPYAYRIFAKHDPGHDWSSLVDVSYLLLEANSQMTATHLPTDWLILDVRRGELRPGGDRDNFYSYDAFRVHWRVAMDEALFQEPRARAYLDRSLAWVVDRWKREQKLPAIITAEGDAGADYEALEMVAALMPALKPRASDVAEAMNRRVQAAYQTGLWGDKDSYYLQNWAWFGTALYNRQLAPFEMVR